jgi:hypothetical protein
VVLVVIIRAGMAQRYSSGLDDRGFESRQGLEIFIFTTTSRPAQGPTHSPVHCVPGSLCMGVKRPESEADHSPVYSAEVKNASIAWCSVKNAQVQLYFYRSRYEI